MPRIQIDPGLLECPDFASDIYTAARAPFINETTTEEQAIQFLKALWTAGNDADKVKWQQQIVDDDLALTETRRQQAEADAVIAQAEVDEAETLRKEEMKKNKTKYLPIPDRDVPTIAPVIASNYAIRKMEKGLYVELWYYTNAGLDDALHSSNTVDDEAMVMLRQSNGSTSWVPAASTKTSLGVIDDKDIRWEDFCQAAPRMIVAMEEADWPQDRVTMLAKFWGNLQVHELRSSTDPLDQKTLLVYQAEQRRLWHLAISSPRGAYNISRINEEIVKKTRERVYWEDRRIKDRERDYRVSKIFHVPSFRDTTKIRSFSLSLLNFSYHCPAHHIDAAMHAYVAPCTPIRCSMHAHTLLHACPYVAPCTPTHCSMHAHLLLHARPYFAPCMPTRCSTHAHMSLHIHNSIVPMELVRASVDGSPYGPPEETHSHTSSSRLQPALSFPRPFSQTPPTGKTHSQEPRVSGQHIRKGLFRMCRMSWPPPAQNRRVHRFVDMGQIPTHARNAFQQNPLLTRRETHLCRLATRLGMF